MGENAHAHLQNTNVLQYFFEGKKKKGEERKKRLEGEKSGGPPGPYRMRLRFALPLKGKKKKGEKKRRGGKEGGEVAFGQSARIAGMA